MRIDFIEVANFRKLISTRIGLSPEKTVFVGANNSGKTSAITARTLGSELPTTGYGRMQTVRFWMTNLEERTFVNGDFADSHCLGGIKQQSGCLRWLPAFVGSSVCPLAIPRRA